MRKSFTRLFSTFVLLLGLSFQMAYGIVFVPANSVPTDGNTNAKPTDFATKFVVAFDVVPVITDAGGTVVIYKNAGLFKTLPLTKTSTSVVVVGKTLEITHGITSFTQGDAYSVAITNGAITDLAAGALMNGVYDFTIGDYVAPKLLTAAASFTPNKGAVDVMTNLDGSAFSLVIPFDEVVNVPTAANNKAVYIYKEDGTVVDIVKVGVVGTTTITGGGTATITVPVPVTAIFQENTTYYVSVDAGAFVDASPNKNAFGGLSSTTTWTFTTRDHSAPVISAKSVTAITTNAATLNVTLAEKGKYYYGVYLATATPSAADVVAGTGALVSGNKTVAAAGTNVTASLTGLADGVAYKAYIVTENSVTVGAPVVGTTSENVAFTTVDSTAPLAIFRGTLNNAEKKTNTLYMVFNEQVVGGTGMLDLRKNSDESYVKSIDATTITSRKITAAEVTANTFGTGRTTSEWVTVVNLDMTLPSNVAYYVVFPSTYIKDMSGNAFAGGGTFTIPVNKSDWAFTSSDFELPAVVVAFSTPTSLTSDITLTFNETVQKQVAGGDWADVIALEQNNNAVAFTVAPGGAANTGVITLTPSAPLLSNTVYTVRLRPDAFKDLNNNAIVTETLYTVTTGDLDPLTLAYSSSEGGTSNLIANSTLTLAFNKAVKVNTTGTTWVNADATNLKPLIAFKKGGTVKAFSVAYNAATFTATITPTDALVSSAADYTVDFDGTKVRDILNVSLAASSVTYTVKDYSAPVAVNSNTGDATLATPTITFTDDNLATLADLSGTLLTALTPTQGAALITFKEGSASGANLGFTITYAAGVITITPAVALETGKTYYYGIGTSVKDAAGNVTAGKFSTFTFVAPAVAPTIVADTYTVNASAQTLVADQLINVVPVSNNVTVTVTFNDNVKEFTTGTPVTLTDGTTTWPVTITTLNVSGKVLTVVFATGATIASDVVCTLTLPAALVQGSVYIAGTTTFAQFAGKTITFKSKDIVKPVASANTPGVAATGVALNTAIKIGFDEKVALGTGNILIKEGATVIQTIPVNSVNVSLDAAGTLATITKTGDLVKYNTTYTLEVPTTAFTDDLSLNPLSAVYSGTFTTMLNPQPTVSTYLPANGADLVATSSSIALTFSEEVVKNFTPGDLTGKGIYLMKKQTGATRASLNGAGVLTLGDDVLVASKYVDDAAVSISANTVTVNFGVALAENMEYYILIGQESFKDKSTGTTDVGGAIPGLYAGIATYGVWNFTTKDVNPPTITYTYSMRADGKVSKTSDITITFSKPIEKVSGTAITSADIATLFTLTKNSGLAPLGTKAFIGEINADKTVVKILNSSLVTLGEYTELSNYTISLNASAIRGTVNNVVLSGSDTFWTSDYTAPVVTPSIVNAIADVKKDEATVLFTCTDNVNLATVYYTIQPGDATTAAPAAAIVKADKMKAVTTASATTTYKFTGLTEKTSYVVWTVAVDEAGNESAINKVVFITDDVTKPVMATLPTSFDAANKLTFTFNEAVTVAAGNMAVRILEKESMKVVAVLNLNAVTPTSVTNDKKLITDAFAGLSTGNTLVNYYVEIDKGLVADVPVEAGDAVNTYDGLFGTELMVTSKDATAPIFLSTTPVLPAAGVDLSFSIKLNFDEAVKKLATIPVDAFLLEREITPGSGTYEPFEVIDPANVVTDGTKVVTLTVDRQLASTTKYQLTVNLAAFEDLAGNDHAAGTILNDITTKDVVAPLVTFAPLNAATGVVPGLTPMTLTFSEAIRLLDNTAIDSYDLDSLVYFKMGTTPMAFNAVIDGAAQVITITPVVATVMDATYTYGFKAKFEDASDNVVPADEATFKTVTTTVAAQYLTWMPVKKTPYVAPWTWLGTTSDVTLNFTEDVFTYSTTASLNNLPVTANWLANTAMVVKKNGVVMAPADLVFTVVDNKTFKVAPKTNWGSGSIIEVFVNNSTLQINEGPTSTILVSADPLYFDQSTYSAQDVVAPKVLATMDTAPFTDGYAPANVGLNGTSPVISKTDALKLYFDEDVKVGTGTVEIHRWDGVLAKSAVNVTVAADKRTVTLGDLTGLPTNQEYYAIVNSGAVVDVTDDNPYAGITAVKVWKFVLKDDAIPQVTSFMPIASNTPVNTDLTINFDRPVILNSGYVAIYKSAAGGDAVQIWRTADFPGAFTFSGNTVTVNISDLDVNNQYFVEVAEGTFKGTSSLKNQAPIARANWSFTTESNAKPVILAYLPAKNATGILLNSDLQITFDMPVEAGTGNIQLHAADGSIVLNFDVKGADVTFADAVVTVNLPALAQNKQYYVIIPSTAVRNTSYTPEYFNGIIVPYEWKFDTVLDGTGPAVVSVSPVGTTGLPLDNISLKLTLSEDVVAGTGDIVVYNAANDTVVATIAIGDATIEGAVVTTANLAGLVGQTTYYVNVADTVLKDKAVPANSFVGISNKTGWKFTTGDFAAPTLVVTPPATPVTTVFTVGLKFSEPVSGVLAGVTATGGKIEIEPLVGGTDYILTVSAKEQTLVTIVLSDEIKDMSASTNNFAGQTLTYTTGDFTKPQMVTWTPTDGETIADNHPELKMSFNENVMVGDGGSLTIYKVATTTPVLTIPITAAMINGKDVTVSYTTTNGLDKNTRYYVLVDGMAIKDNAGNAFDGVSDVAAWTFKTGANFATIVDIEKGSLEFKVYPNPFVEYVNVDNASKLSKVVVTNIAGQIVKEVVNPTNRIQLNELRSGIYFISLYNMDNVIAKTAKVVKR